jgi:hypothetical protein
MRTFQQTIDQLLDYDKLKPGWGGSLSLPPRAGMVQLVACFVNGIPQDLPPPKPMISSSGVIGLYWDEPRSYIDIEFRSQEDISVFVVYDKQDKTKDRWFPHMTVPEFTHQFFLDHFQQLKEEAPCATAEAVTPT